MHEDYESENDGYLEISNIDKLVNFSRRLIYYNFDDESEELSDEDFFDKEQKIKHKDATELDKLLPFEEAKSIMQTLIVKKRHKKTKILKMFMRESDYDSVLIQLNEKNDFIFWVKDKYDDENEQPETD